MKFGKRTKSWGAVGRRILGDREKAVSNGVAQDERHALLDSNPPPELTLVEEENTVNEEVYPAHEPVALGDPTQHLLTALGRFQRQVNRAESGAPAEIWTDDCIEQLVEGIEVAIQNDWHDVQEALTDTARVLQSYENVGKASEAVEFLQDSYEILCLMVGDLIVDNIRSGVMQKWRDRFTRAKTALAQAGIPLIDDEGMAPPVEEEPVPHNEIPVTVEEPVAEEEPAPQQKSSIIPFSMPEPAEEITEEIMPTESEAEPVDMGSPFDLPEAREEVSAEAPAPELDEVIAEERYPLPEQTEEAIIESDSDELIYEPVSETGSEMVTPVEFEDDSLDELPLFSAAGLATENYAEPESATVISEEDLEIVFEDELVQEDDVVEEEVLEVEEEVTSEDPIEINPAQELEAFAQELEDAAPESPEPELVLDEIPETEPGVIEATVETEAPAEETLFEIPAATAPPEPEVPAAPQAAAGSAEALLYTTQQAMAQGNVVDAKMFALELAVCMARQEIESAQGGVAATEAILMDNQKAIKNAEREVTAVDTKTRTVVRALEEQQSLLSDKNNAMDTLREDMGNVDTGIADLEEQIKALQESLEEERTKRADQATTLTQYQNEATRVKGEINRLSEEESKIRQVLAQAEDAVANLLDTQLACRSDIEDAQAILRKKEEAVQDIERTMGHVAERTSIESGDVATENETE